MNNITIGIPRSLFYHKYKYLWTTFFKELGINILISPYTDENILNRGKKISNNKLCLPLQIYIGHVDYLINRTTYILIPRFNDDNKCYNFLYDLINNLFECNILNLNVTNSDEEAAFINIGKQLGFTRQAVINAYKIAKKEEYKQLKINYLIQQKRLKKNNKKTLIISDDYIGNDEFIKRKIIHNNDVEVFYSNTINPDIKIYKKAIKENIETLIKSISDVIYISTNPCILKNIILDDQNIKKIIYDINGKAIYDK